MLSQSAIRAAAQLLRNCRADHQRIPGLPPDLRPTTRAEGYAIQAASLAAVAGVSYGWKIAATSAAGQAHIGVDGPVAGRLLPSWVHPESAEIRLRGNAMRLAECEFAFRLDQPLPARAQPYTRDEVTDAIGTLHPAIEIPDTRFEQVAQVGAAQLIADGACSREFVLGEAAPVDWRSIMLDEHPVVARVFRDGRQTGSDHVGRGGNALGHPLAALVWIANELSALGIGLAAGEVVTTGTCVAPIPVIAGDMVRAAFGALGTVGIRFVD